MTLSEFIKEQALDLGFDLVGLTSARPHKDSAFFREWIGKGHHASMAWMERGAEKRANPDLILPGAKSLIMCGLIYNHPHDDSRTLEKKGHGWISSYAWGDDYHRLMIDRLEVLEERVRARAPNAKFLSYCDTGPILERSYAASAGLGWIGKNTCLINTKKGSYFFIGEIITDLELDDDLADTDHCGTCTRCIDACPTQALVPYELDANKCISYLTLEHHGDIPENLAAKMGHHLAGCDICQEVCPWNKKAPASREVAFKPRPELFHPRLDALPATEEAFRDTFKNNSLKRLKLKRLQRNATIARSVKPRLSTNG
jgi:epoxyqueuosine reductase